MCVQAKYAKSLLVVEKQNYELVHLDLVDLKNTADKGKTNITSLLWLTTLDIPKHTSLAPKVKLGKYF